MFRDIERVLIDRDRIAERVGEIADRLAADLRRELAAEGAGEEEHRVVFIPIMTGSIVFVSDLIRRLPMKLSMQLVTVSSYPGETMESKGAHLRGELPAALEGKHIVLVDDILDSGRTLHLVRSLVMERSPASVRTVVLLDKKARREAPIEPDYFGFDIPDEFVVGYGLDYNGYYRNLPDIGTLNPEAAIGSPSGSGGGASG
ncbi:MAG: hypoxanthine phosphoribosyltransferase [Phycisphaeraceae bacterium]|nr:MAG: hypoxanthine phosphoribosyltransferase [Phycisphaeraceae bacterium]